MSSQGLRTGRGRRIWMSGFVLPVSLICAALLGSAEAWAQGQSAIVQDGKPRAQIVLAEQRTRMATLAALELQHYVERISGASLPIVTEPTNNQPIHIHVGPSLHTDELGVTDDGLQYGAYRIVSGDDWLVLLGDDQDYTPPEPWARNNGNIPRAEEEWDKLTSKYTDTAWGFPFASYYKKHWDRGDRTVQMTERFGEKNAKWWQGGDFSYGFWSDDEGGSLNAVYAWLETLGARWYMPGELGQVIPEKPTITLDEFDRTVKPDFGLRSWFWYNYGIFPLEDVLWARRIGINGGDAVLAGGQNGFAHGHVRVHTRQAMKEKHPEYYALRGNVRDTEHRGHGTACYSSEGLEDETVTYGRFMFDHYDRPTFSIWPGDGFRHCQCEQCIDKSASELVWGFVDRVARRLHDTHPNRLVLCGAYTPYRQPPESIEQFSPNVVVDIANRGRPGFTVPKLWHRYREEIERWRAVLAPRRIIRGDNNRYTIGDDPEPFPVIQATAMAKDIKMLKGISLGEISEQSQRRGLLNPALNHIGLYVQTKYLWDADQNLDELMDEYYRLFYGPAEQQMKQAIAFAEAAYSRAVAEAGGSRSPSSVPIADRIKLVKMLQAARESAGETIYGRRVQAWLDDLQSIDELRQLQREQAQAEDQRKDAPLVVAHASGNTQKAQAHSLKHIVTGNQPEIATTFQVAWEDNVLVFDIRCEEPDMENLFVSSQVWDGDSVALLLESPTHAYYQIEINPDGKVYDSARNSIVGARWQSQVQVTPEHGDDYWRLTVRVPVVSPAQGESDPNHNVAGPQPTAENPWYFNIGRLRARGLERDAYMFSPPGEMSYHQPEHFARLIVR